MRRLLFKIKYAYAAHQWKKLLGPGMILADVEAGYEWYEYKRYKKELRNR